MSKRTVLITGASSGIGKELAHLFARDGYDLVLVARNRNALEILSYDLQTTYQVQTWVYVQDLAEPNAAEKVFAYTNSHDIKIHTLVNNAGFGQTVYFKESNIQEQMNMIQVNVTTLVKLTRLYLDYMILKNEGGILNIGSVASFIPGPSMAVYFATKSFVKSFTESLSVELSKTKIHVTALCPGATSTEFFNRAGTLKKGNPAIAGIMTAKRVAAIGYRALKWNRTVVVAGFTNALSVQLMKHLPLFLQKFIVRIVLGVW